MKNQMNTYKFFWSPKKEENWLEQMSLNGWHLKKVSSFNRYTFEKGAPEKRTYKIDHRVFRSPLEQDDYLALFSDSGWQAVMPRGVNYAYYFHTTGGGSALDIYSDEVSRAQRNLRYATIMARSLIPSFLPLFVLYLTGTIQFNNIGYLTPGLWEMTGSEFVFHFLFETPFVLMRTSLYFLPIITLALGLFFLLRYYQVYRRELKQQVH
jgi:hypothetical protein